MVHAGATNVFDVELAPSFNVAPQPLRPAVRLDRTTSQRESAINALERRVLLVQNRKGRLQHDQRAGGYAHHESCLPPSCETAVMSVSGGTPFRVARAGSDGRLAQSSALSAPRQD